MQSPIEEQGKRNEALQDDSDFMYQAAVKKYTITEEEIALFRKITGLPFLSPSHPEFYSKAKLILNQEITNRAKYNQNNWFGKYIWPKRTSHLNLVLHYITYHQINTERTKNPEIRLLDHKHRSKDNYSGKKFRRMFSRISRLTYFDRTNYYLKQLQVTFVKKQTDIEKSKKERAVFDVNPKVREIINKGRNDTVTANLNQPIHIGERTKIISRFFEPVRLSEAVKSLQQKNDSHSSSPVVTILMRTGLLTELSDPELQPPQERRGLQIIPIPSDHSSQNKSSFSDLPAPVRRYREDSEDPAKKQQKTQERREQILDAYSKITLCEMVSLFKENAIKAAIDLMQVKMRLDNSPKRREETRFDPHAEGVLSEVCTMVKSVKAAELDIIKYGNAFSNCVSAAITANQNTREQLKTIKQDLSTADEKDLKAEIEDLLAKVKAQRDLPENCELWDDQFIKVKTEVSILTAVEKVLTEILEDPTNFKKIIDQSIEDSMQEWSQLLEMQRCIDQEGNLVDATKRTVRAIIHLADHATNKWGIPERSAPASP